MGIKDKLKRSSRVFSSDCKENVSENRSSTAGAKEEAKTTTEPKAVPDAAEAACTAKAATPEADAAIDAALDDVTGNDHVDEDAAVSKGEGAREAVADATNPAPAADATAEVAAEDGKKPVKEGNAIKRSLSKRAKSKANTPAPSGEARRGEIFHKFMKKFRRPVGVPAGKSAQKSAEKTAKKVEASGADKAEISTDNAAVATEAGAVDAANAARDALLDPATAPEAVTETAGTVEPAK